MAAISIDDRTSWVVARWAFRTLVERAAALVDGDDKRTLNAAIALDGLHIDLLDADERPRIVRALRDSASTLRNELATQTADPRDSELAAALKELDHMLPEAPHG